MNSKPQARPNCVPGHTAVANERNPFQVRGESSDEIPGGDLVARLRNVIVDIVQVPPVPMRRGLAAFLRSGFSTRSNVAR